MLHRRSCPLHNANQIPPLSLTPSALATTWDLPFGVHVESLPNTTFQAVSAVAAILNLAPVGTTKTRGLRDKTNDSLFRPAVHTVQGKPERRPGEPGGHARLN